MENLKVLVYELDGWKDLIEVRLECVKQIDGSDLWAIREKGCCLNKQGEWEIEPIPSSRTNAFYKRCRWNSAEAALKFWHKGHQSRFEHYRARANNACTRQGEGSRQNNVISTGHTSVSSDGTTPAPCG